LPLFAAPSIGYLGAMPDESEDTVLIAVAARISGVPVRTIRAWVKAGKLAASPGAAGRVVQLADVQQLAATSGQAYRTVEDGPPEAEASPVAAGFPATRHDTASLPALLAALESVYTGRLADQERQHAALLAAKDALIEELRRRAEAAEAAHAMIGPLADDRSTGAMGEATGQAPKRSWLSRLFARS
jgi:DNA-binding transcriptional MerR regulator